MDEQWKQIDNYPNYEISNFGRIKNINTNNITFGTCNKNIGYMRVKLSNNKQTKTFQVHRLVAQAFIPNPENKPEVNHLNGKTDNRSIMLEWVTRKENMQHATQNKSNNNGCVKLYKIDPTTKKTIHIYDKISDAYKEGYTEWMINRVVNTEKIYKNFLWKKDINVNAIFTNEIWVDLKNSIYDEVNIFPKYKISNYGRIMGHYNRILKLHTFNGYHNIQLYNDNVQKGFKIHRLMMMAFNIPNPLNKTDVDHIDKNITNNHLSNLRWATKEEQSENLINCVKVNCIDIYGNSKIYNSLKSCEKIINISSATIKKYMLLGIQYKNYTFKQVL
jgi:hypothetical protein